jgi:hypothetical protein
MGTRGVRSTPWYSQVTQAHTHSHGIHEQGIPSNPQASSWASFARLDGGREEKTYYQHGWIWLPKQQDEPDLNSCPSPGTTSRAALLESHDALRWTLYSYLRHPIVLTGSPQQPVPIASSLSSCQSAVCLVLNPCANSRETMTLERLSGFTAFGSEEICRYERYAPSRNRS